jgi:membrane protein DedA with SNARE-associated domain
MLDIVREFGYLFVFIGSFIEGDDTLVMAGVVVREGSLTFAGVVAIAVVSSFLSHYSFYLLGHLGGRSFLARLRNLESRVLRVYSLVRRYETAGVFIFQYVLGFPLAGSVAFGLAGMSPLKYGLLQLISCLVWSSLLSLLGYIFGYSAELYFKDVGKVLLVVMFLGLVLAWGVKRTFDSWYWRRISVGLQSPVFGPAPCLSVTDKFKVEI